ncbi:hypothetical protein [Ralstonia solanacearum]|uniref:hypothetical protein n=1 Tax=Ralstonia solanacearum TaxID=305 RepID=UPI000A11F0CF|nr:hypothetical protein [Ralstonia solanacearum]
MVHNGSTDENIPMAEDCGAQGHRFTWGEEFSAAPKGAVQFAEDDWNLVMDAHQWLENGARELLQASTFRPPLRVVRRQNLDEDGGAAQRNNNWIPPLLPRGGGHQGRRHQQPVAPPPRLALPPVVRHHGYHSAKLEKKRGRHGALLHPEQVEQPEEP